MGIVSDCGVHVAALGAGLLGVCLGNGGGAVDASIGAAGLIGFVLGKETTFGPECARIRADIEKDVRKKYAARNGSVEEADIEAAADALKDSLGACVIDRAALAKTAVTPEGFPTAAIRHIMTGLASSNPEFFGERAERDSALTFRFAQDMVEAAITSAIDNRKYYEQLEPHLMLEMASALGAVRAVQAEHTRMLEQILAAMSNTPEKRQAEEAGVTGEQFRALAETALKKATTAQDALDYFTSLIDFAKKEAKARKQPRNIDEFLQRVLDRASKFIEKSQREKANAEYAKALAQIEDEEENTKQRKRVVLDRAIDNDILRLDFTAAANRMGTRTALDLSEGQSLFAAMRKVQVTWYERGLKHGGKLDLELSVALAEKTIDLANNDNQRGIALNDFANTLQVLGSRGEGKAAVEALAKSVAAYENALKVYTLEHMPAPWATTQNNLGAVYQTLGSRGEGKAAVEALAISVAAYENALKVYTLQDMPADWAMTQNNRGNAYATLGSRGEGEAAVDALAKSVAAYENALIVRTQKDMPADWAGTQNNLGVVYRLLGSRGEGKAAVEAFAKSVAAYENALKVRTQKDMPALWAMTRENMALVYLTMVEKQATSTPHESLRKARSAVTDALTVYEQPGMEFYLEKARLLLADIEAAQAALQ